VSLLGGLLHRMIFWELVKVFALALTSLTGLFLIGLVIQQANQLGLSLVQTLTVLPLLIPYTLPYTIPATTLFASCVVYGRLAHDNEAVAMKAAGVNLLTVVRPAVTLGVITAAATFALAHSVIPHTQAALQRAILRDPEEVLYNLLKRDKCFKANNFPYVIHVKDVRNRRLADVVVKRKEMVHDSQTGKPTWTGRYDMIVRSREARLRVGLPDGAGPDDKPMLYIDADRWASVLDGTNFAVDGNAPVPVPLPDAFSGKELRDKPVNLTWPELPAKADAFRAELAAVERQIAANREALGRAADPDQRKAIEAHTAGLRDHMAVHWVRQIRNTECEYHMRPALAVGCLVFAVIGCPVGMWANRADYLSAFVTCFLPTVCVYYPLLLAGSNMGRDGRVAMPAGVYLADVVVGALAVVLTVKLIRR
jgi:lipopolysaccharide export system permease protein